MDVCALGDAPHQSQRLGVVLLDRLQERTTSGSVPHAVPAEADENTRHVTGLRAEEVGPRPFRERHHHLHRLREQPDLAAARAAVLSPHLEPAAPEFDLFQDEPPLPMPDTPIRQTGALRLTRASSCDDPAISYVPRAPEESTSEKAVVDPQDRLPSLPLCDVRVDPSRGAEAKVLSAARHIPQRGRHSDWPTRTHGWRRGRRSAVATGMTLMR